MAESKASRGLMMNNLSRLEEGESMSYGAVDSDPDAKQESYPGNETREGVVNGARKRIIFALSVCSILLVAEIAGAALSGSLAILADAGHLISDIVTYIISLTSIWLAEKPPSKKYTFGLLRAEVLGAMFSVIISVGLAIVLTYFAIMRIVHRDFDIDGTVMLVISAINFSCNIIQVMQLQFGFCCCEGVCSRRGRDEDKLLTPSHHGHHRAHNHGHSHGISWPSRSKENGDADEITEHMNVRAACLHIFGDSLFGFGLLVGALLIYFKPEWKIADPILTIVFGIIVLLTLIGLFRDTVHILMAGSPPGFDFDETKRRLVEIDGVEGVHSLRIWSLTSDVTHLTVHLVLAKFYDSKPVDSTKVLHEARHILETNFGVVQTTIQFETVDDGVDFLCARTPGPA